MWVASQVPQHKKQFLPFFVWGISNVKLSCIGYNFGLIIRVDWWWCLRDRKGTHHAVLPYPALNFGCCEFLVRNTEGLPCPCDCVHAVLYCSFDFALSGPGSFLADLQLLNFWFNSCLWACLVHEKWTQKALQYLSHQILRHMHGVLNVDERKKTNYTV
jgi:hypothetical protein